MNEPSNVANRLAELERAVAALAARLDAVDGGAAQPVASTAAPSPPPLAASTTDETIHLPSFERLQGVPALAGRTCISRRRTRSRRC